MLKKNILITGGAGFIGSNFVKYYMSKYPEHNIINLDALTYAGNMENLSDLPSSPHYHFIKGDISDHNLIEDIFNIYQINSVIHFAAESHVDNSIKNPHIFLKTNVEGTFNLLEAARKYWLDSPHKPKNEFLSSRFHHISTDEVYGSLGEEGYFTEQTPYAPNSPYSASKAASDFLVRSYHHTFGLNVVISNCSNNYGPNQHEEKFIPVIIKKALNLEPIPVYGNGKNIRDWLYVFDHCRAIDLIYNKGKNGESYNIGGKNERNNLQIVEKICKLLDEKKPRADGKKYLDLLSFVPDRFGHDQRYAIDAGKIEQELGWQAEENFETGIEKTIDFYLQKYNNRNHINKTQETCIK